MRFIIDDKIPYIRPFAEQMGECVYLPGSEITAADVREADCLIVRTRTRVDEALLKDSRVQLVVTATIGYDHIDTQWLEQQGIHWANCPGCNATSVAQYVEGALWPSIPDATPLVGSHPRVAIVGVGHVGSAVRTMLESRGVECLLVDPFLGLTDEPWEADVVTFHTPLTFEGPCPSYHMASDDFFARLQCRPVIINAARGGVVDESALLRALDRGLVSAAVIDTWEHEPSPNPELLRRAQVATPHIAGYSAVGKANATWMSLQAVRRHFGLEVALPPSGGELLREALETMTEAPQISPLPYDPRYDTAELRRDPSRFEWLRGHYPLRLE